MTEAFSVWCERQYRHAAAAMLRSVSPVALCKVRPGFGQSVTPKRGAVIASPVLGSYDPDPDYFFHWYRDSAIIVEALRVLFEDDAAHAALARDTALGHFADFVQFSLALRELDGRRLAAAAEWRTRIKPDFLRFVRSDQELSGIHGARVAGETRVNPDGSLDISSWPRPQNDGPALRALTVLRWSRAARLAGETAAAAEALLRADLTYTQQHWRDPSFDIWEEEQGSHYYTVSVCRAALEEGAAWLAAAGDRAQEQRCRAEAHAARAVLDGFWLAEAGFYRSRALQSAVRSTKELDIAVIMAAVHGSSSTEEHSVRDARMHATLACLEQLFDSAYEINRQRPAQRGTAMGRYAGDVYYSGGAYYFSTLAAAEFCYRAAAGAADARAWIERGDAFVATVRAFTPADGDLAEQFDQHTGAQTSAKQLAWSYAAFITSVAARRAVARV